MPDPGFYPDIPEETYHRDPSSLSVSGAKNLLRSPAYYRWVEDHPVHKDVYDVGTAFHTKTLGVGPEIAVIDAASWQSKAAQQQQLQARNDGKTPILAKDDEHTTGMANAVLNDPAIARWIQGQPEVSAYALDETTGLMRRCRFDVLGDIILGDLKSTRDASPESFAKDCANYRYHMQAAWYLDVAAALDHPAVGFAFIAVEKTPPYQPAVYELDADAIDLGRDLNRRALDLYDDCVRNSRWPSYGNGQPYQTLSLPAWAYKESA